MAAWQQLWLRGKRSLEWQWCDWRLQVQRLDGGELRTCLKYGLYRFQTRRFLANGLVF